MYKANYLRLFLAPQGLCTLGNHPTLSTPMRIVRKSLGFSRRQSQSIRKSKKVRGGFVV